MNLLFVLNGHIFKMNHPFSWNQYLPIFDRTMFLNQPSYVYIFVSFARLDIIAPQPLATDPFFKPFLFNRTGSIIRGPTPEQPMSASREAPRWQPTTALERRRPPRLPVKLVVCRSLSDYSTTMYARRTPAPEPKAPEQSLFVVRLPRFFVRVRLWYEQFCSLP